MKAGKLLRQQAKSTYFTSLDSYTFIVDNKPILVDNAPIQGMVHLAPRKLYCNTYKEFDEKMKKKWIIAIPVAVCMAAYVYAYYTARRDHILVRRIIPHGTGRTLTLQNHIIPGRFGAGRGGILASPDLIGFCNFIFTPLRKLEATHWNMKSSNHNLERTR